MANFSLASSEAEAAQANTAATKTPDQRQDGHGGDSKSGPSTMCDKTDPLTSSIPARNKKFGLAAFLGVATAAAASQLWRAYFPIPKPRPSGWRMRLISASPSRSSTRSLYEELTQRFGVPALHGTENFYGCNARNMQPWIEASSNVVAHALPFWSVEASNSADRGSLAAQMSPFHGEGGPWNVDVAHLKSLIIQARSDPEKTEALQRTGTQRRRTVLLNVLHDDPKTQGCGYEAGIDMPASLFWEDFYQMFPDTPVHLVLRSPAKQAASNLNFVRRLQKKNSYVNEWIKFYAPGMPKALDAGLEGTLWKILTYAITRGLEREGMLAVRDGDEGVEGVLKHRYFEATLKEATLEDADMLVRAMSTGAPLENFSLEAYTRFSELWALMTLESIECLHGMRKLPLPASLLSRDSCNVGKNAEADRQAAIAQNVFDDRIRLFTIKGESPNLRMYNCNDVFDMTFSHELATQQDLTHIPNKQQVCGKEWMNRNGTNDFETKVIFAWFWAMGILVVHWRAVLACYMVLSTAFYQARACRKSVVGDVAAQKSQPNTQSFSKKTITTATRTKRASSGISTGSLGFDDSQKACGHSAQRRTSQTFAG